MIVIRRRTCTKSSALFATYALPSAGQTGQGQKRRQARQQERAVIRKERRSAKRWATDNAYNNPATREPSGYRQNFKGGNWEGGSTIGELNAQRYYKNPEAFVQERQKINDAFKNAQQSFKQEVKVEPPKINIDIDPPKGKINPKLLLAGAAALGVAGIGGAMFTRRRRTKNGKIVVEQVRR